MDERKAIDILKQALKELFYNIEEVREKYPTFQDAVFKNVPDEYKLELNNFISGLKSENLDSLLSKAMKEIFEEEDSNIIDETIKKLFGVSLDVLIETLDYLDKKRRFRVALEEVSKITGKKESNIVLMLNYSEPIEFRLNQLINIIEKYSEKTGKNMDSVLERIVKRETL